MIHSDEEECISTLLERYKRPGSIYRRPVYNISETVHVSFGVALIDLLELDEYSQVGTLYIWERMVSDQTCL